PLTDFGSRDLYVGQVKAVLAALAEEAVSVVLRQPVLRVAAFPDVVGRHDRAGIRAELRGAGFSGRRTGDRGRSSQPHARLAARAAHVCQDEMHLGLKRNYQVMPAAEWPNAIRVARTSLLSLQRPTIDVETRRRTVRTSPHHVRRTY